MHCIEKKRRVDGRDCMQCKKSKCCPHGSSKVRIIKHRKQLTKGELRDLYMENFK